MIRLILSVIIGFVAVAWPAWTWVNTAPALPQVDLGYEIHEALIYNVSGYSAVTWQVPLPHELNPTKKTTRRFIFRNIRYAQAPTGDLRLAPPVAPTGVNPVVQRGNESRICPRNMLEDLSGLEESLQVPGTTEDCLFLDVVVPRQVFDGRGPCPTKIFVHFHMFDNEKDRVFDLQRYIEDDSVYVRANYRLANQVKELHDKSDESAELGKLDQDLASKWVQQNIHLFARNHGDIYTIKSSLRSKKDT